MNAKLERNASKARGVAAAQGAPARPNNKGSGVRRTVAAIRTDDPVRTPGSLKINPVGVVWVSP